MMFIMMVGIPASGKSTWVEKFLAEVENRSKWIVISSDDYIDMRAAQDGITYTEAFPIYAKDAEKACLESAKFAVENEMNIIWDQTNLTKKVRKKRLALIPETYQKYYYYSVAPKYEELCQRLESRPGKIIPIEVLAKMIETAELPTLEEGFNGSVK